MLTVREKLIVVLKVSFGYQSLFLKISLVKMGRLIIRVILYSGQYGNSCPDTAGRKREKEHSALQHAGVPPPSGLIQVLSPFLFLLQLCGPDSVNISL